MSCCVVSYDVLPCLPCCVLLRRRALLCFALLFSHGRNASSPGTFFGFVGAQASYDVIIASFFFVQFFAGICIFFIVAWLIAYRLEEAVQCWKIHARIRYYFGLTALATAVNLGIGICGTLFITLGPQ